MLGLIIIYAYGTRAFLETKVLEATKMGPARLLSQEITYRARQMELFCTFHDDVKVLPITVIQQKLYDDGDVFMQLFGDVRTNPDFFTPKSIQTWTNESIPIVRRDPVGYAFNRQLDIVNVLNLFGSYASDLANLDFDNLNCTSTRLKDLYNGNQIEHKFIGVASWSFLLDNSAKPVFDSLFKAIEVSNLDIGTLLQQQQVLFLAICLSSGILPFCITICLVIPTFSRLKRERKAVMTIFCNLPKEVIQELAEVSKTSVHRLEASTSESATKGNNRFDRQGTTGSIGGDSSRFGSSKLDNSSNGSDNVTSLDDTTGKIHKTFPSWMIVIFFFSGGMLALFSVLVSSTILMYSASQDAFRSATEIYHAGTREAETFRLLVLAQEMIRRDSYVWPDSDKLAEIYKESIETAYEIHEALKYGNETLGLSGSVNRYQAQDDLLNDPKCFKEMDICQSFDEMYHFYLQQATLVLQTQRITFTSIYRFFKT
jgi:hypothetical protein